MGTTKKPLILGGNFWSLAARIRDESAGSRRKRRSLDLRPPAAPPSHTPLGKSIPRLIKSSKHTLGPASYKSSSYNLLVHSTKYRI